MCENHLSSKIVYAHVKLPVTTNESFAYNEPRIYLFKVASTLASQNHNVLTHTHTHTQRNGPKKSTRWSNPSYLHYTTLTQPESLVQMLWQIRRNTRKMR